MRLFSQSSFQLYPGELHILLSGFEMFIYQKLHTYLTQGTQDTTPVATFDLIRRYYFNMLLVIRQLIQI